MTYMPAPLNICIHASWFRSQTRVDTVRADGVDAQCLQEGKVARAAGRVGELVDDCVCALGTHMSTAG
jgi:hypothetical protein